MCIAHQAVAAIELVGKACAGNKGRFAAQGLKSPAKSSEERQGAPPMTEFPIPPRGTLADQDGLTYSCASIKRSAVVRANVEAASVANLGIGGGI